MIRLGEAQRLTEAGRYQELLDYLEPSSGEALDQSPTLALLCGSANARLGRDEEAAMWADLALDRAKQQGDLAVEARALNVRGAIALEAGRLEEAESFFTRGLDAAKRQDDHSTVGRCSNNLGIIADQRGDCGKAQSWYRLALAAYQQVGWDRGITETHHNLAMTHLAEGKFRDALTEADHAIHQADKLGDPSLGALALAGRAEIRVLEGDAAFGRSEIERALAKRREVGDVVGEAYDLRVLAMALAAGGYVQDAEELLRDVIERGAHLGRPHLAATAGRELANLLVLDGRLNEARQVASVARDLFEQLGAEADVSKLTTIVEAR